MKAKLIKAGTIAHAAYSQPRSVNAPVKSGLATLAEQVNAKRNADPKEVAKHARQLVKTTLQD